MVQARQQKAAAAAAAAAAAGTATDAKLPASSAHISPRSQTTASSSLLQSSSTVPAHAGGSSSGGSGGSSSGGKPGRVFTTARPGEGNSDATPMTLLSPPPNAAAATSAGGGGGGSSAAVSRPLAAAPVGSSTTPSPAPSRRAAGGPVTQRRAEDAPERDLQGADDQLAPFSRGPGVASDDHLEGDYSGLSEGEIAAARREAAAAEEVYATHAQVEEARHALSHASPEARSLVLYQPEEATVAGLRAFTAAISKLCRSTHGGASLADTWGEGEGVGMCELCWSWPTASRPWRPSCWLCLGAEAAAVAAQ